LSIVESYTIPDMPFTLPELLWGIGGALIVVGAVIMIKRKMERRRRSKN